MLHMWTVCFAFFLPAISIRLRAEKSSQYRREEK